MTNTRRSRGRRVSPRVALVLVALACLAAAASCSRFMEQETATKGTIVVCASESHFGLMKAEVEDFTDLYKEANITLVGAPTREAIVNLLNDSVSVAVVDRLLNAEEERVVQKAKLKLEKVEVALDAVAVVVNSVNDTPGITEETLRGILLRQVTEWNRIPGSGLSGPIQLVMTGRNSGIYELVKDRFFNLKEDIQPSVVLPSQTEVLEYVSDNPQAVGLVSLAAMEDPSVLPLSADSTNALIRALSFAGRDSTGKAALFKLHQAHIYLGKYPLSYPVYIYFRKNSNLSAGFVGFVTSAAGQKIILNWGLVPATMPVRIVTLD